MKFPKLDIFPSYLLATSLSALWGYLHFYTGSITANLRRWVIHNWYIIILFPEYYAHLESMAAIWQGSGQWSHGGRPTRRVPEKIFAFWPKGQEYKGGLLVPLLSFFLHEFDNSYEQVVFGVKRILLCPMREKNHWDVRLLLWSLSCNINPETTSWISY